MIQAYYNWTHTIGLHFYTIPTIISALVLMISGGVHTHKQKQREEEYGKQLDQIRGKGTEA